MAKKLADSLYQGAEDRIIMVGDICGFPGAEIEDLFPTHVLAGLVSRMPALRTAEEDFVDVAAEGRPIVPQIEAFARAHGIALQQGWKVDLAKRTKSRLLHASDPLKGDSETAERWQALFTDGISAR